MKFVPLGVALAATIALAGCSDPANWPSREFTPVAWAKTPVEERYVFARDLIDNHRLIGLTFPQVEAMLGEPTVRSDGMLIYYIKDGGTMWPYVLLDLRADVNGKVVSAGIREAD